MGRIADNILPPLIGILCGIFFAKWDTITYENSEDLIKQFPTIGTWIFGFILTVFSIIIQGNNEVVLRMKSSKKAFARFVRYNFKVVTLSMIATLYSYVSGHFKFDVTTNSLNILAVIFCSILIWLAIEIFYFLMIFYLLLQGEIKTKK
jgi:hypothetical protein